MTLEATHDLSGEGEGMTMIILTSIHMSLGTSSSSGRIPSGAFHIVLPSHLLRAKKGPPIDRNFDAEISALCCLYRVPYQVVARSLELKTITVRRTMGHQRRLPP